MVNSGLDLPAHSLEAHPVPMLGRVAASPLFGCCQWYSFSFIYSLILQMFIRPLLGGGHLMGRRKIICNGLNEAPQKICPYSGQL